MKAAVALVVLVVSSIFLFTRLGHYALWDDEALTALTARGVWQSGDTSAVLGDNIVAYRNGLLIRNMKDRSSPPLQFYLAAPFLGLMGDSAFAARLPFAICGLGCIGLMLWWLHRDKASSIAWMVTAIAILGNVSLFLFCRQARYYAPAMLLSVAVAYSYFHVRTHLGLLGHSILSIVLLAANTMSYAVVMSMMLVDYAGWGRKEKGDIPIFRPRRWSRKIGMSPLSWLILLAPQVIGGAIVVSIWNPLRIAEPRQQFSWLEWHARLLWRNLRDLNTCEFGSGALLLAAPLVWLATRSRLHLRAIVALVVAIVVVSVLSPQNPSRITIADVRYLSFLIPLCIAVGVMTIQPLAKFSRVAAIALACVAYGCNVLNFSFVTAQPLRSTVYDYANELIHPIPEPYTPTANWIRKNVSAGQSVLVLPDYMMYPLMFHAPNAVYAWQLTDPPPPHLGDVAPIHVSSRVPPDYIVAFGPAVNTLHTLLVNTAQPLDYEVEHQIDVYWRDLYRPELFWRAFEPPESNFPGIFILKRVPPASSFRL